MIKMQDILQQRLANGDTVKNISKSTGVSLPVIYRLLTGNKQRYSTYVAEQLSKCFGIEIKEVEEFQNVRERRGNLNKTCAVTVKPIKEKQEIIKKDCRKIDCMLNKEGKCMSDHINLGLAGCASYNKEPNNLPKDLSSSNRKMIVLNQEACIKYNSNGVK